MKDELLRTTSEGDLDASPEVVVRRAMRLRMFNELEVLRYPSLNCGNIDETVIVEGREHLDRALEGGKGAIVMIGHFGANQLIMPALGHRGYSMNQLSASPTAWASIRSDGRVNPVWQKVQQRRWLLEKSLPAKHIDVFGFLRPAYRCLEKNEVLGLAFDGGGGSRWVEMPLGRRRAWVSTQPWQLARSTGAAVVPTIVLRLPWQRIHRVIMKSPMRVAKTVDRLGDVAQAAEAFGRWFTRRLVRHPDHYLPYLLLRRRVADSDERPFFSDYPTLQARS